MAKIKAARIHGIQVSVCGLNEIGDYADQGITHLVSISDAHLADNENSRAFIESVFPSAVRHFDFFNDLFSPASGNHPPTLGAVRTILKFAEALRKNDHLQVHCNMGISRSTAIAFAILCLHAGPGLETECLTALKKIRESAFPNPLIVHFADDLLRRDGAMIQAVKAG